MMKNRAVWVALAVVAIAAILMFFVVLPQIRDDKSVEQLAQKAGEVTEQTKDAASSALDQAADKAKDVAGEVKTEAGKVAQNAADALGGDSLEKMSRMKSEATQALNAFQSLLAKGKAPTAEEIAAAKAKLAEALKEAADIQLPEGVEAVAGDVVSKMKEGAAKLRASVEAIPTDADGARKAFEAVKAELYALVGATPPAAENPDDAAAEPAATATETAAAADEQAPTFDVLRVEPDGSTVIAGRAEPEATVEIVDGDKVITSTKAGESGDFVAILDDPLPAGDHQLVLKSTDKDGKPVVSSEVATVSVPEDKSGELLAMVTKPGEASRIMAMPTAKEETPADTASAETAADTASAGTAVVPQDAAADAATPADAASAGPAAENPIVMPELPAASTEIANRAPLVAQDETAISQGTTGQAEAVVRLGEGEAVTRLGEEARTDTADAGKPQQAAPEVLVSAVEIEGDRIFVAGNARPNAVVRVYADDRLVAEITADENGRFVADNVLPLAVGQHQIRADMLSADGKKVEVRASVPFFRPEGEQLAAVATEPMTPEDHPMQPLADGAFDKAREEANKAVALLKDLYKDGDTPSQEELAAARSATEIALKTLAEIKVPAEVDAVAREMAAHTAGEAAKALALLKSLPNDAKAVQQALASIDAAVTSAIAPAMAKVAKPEGETQVAASDASAVEPSAQAQADVKPAEAAQETQSTEVKAGKVARQTAGADGTAATDQAVASAQVKSEDAAGETVNAAGKGDRVASQQLDVAAADADEPKTIEQAPLTESRSSVIIRRGDTLWQISRRVYGAGVRYTTIYLANQTQITDPDRILPGQIFDVPEKYLPNAEEVHRERVRQRRHN